MKRFFKKTALIILLFVLLAINLLVIADSSQTLVNLGASLKFSTEKEEVLTGEAHKVTIKSAYADPNNEMNAIYKIYLKNKDGSPNTNVQILNMKDNKITYEDLNALGDVDVILKEEKDSAGNITKRYLEYALRPGMTIFMEIEFWVPAGKIREEKLVLGGEIEYSNDDEKSIEETNVASPSSAPKMMLASKLKKGIKDIEIKDEESIEIVEEIDNGSGNNELPENEEKEDLAIDKENNSGEAVEEKKQDEEVNNEEQNQDDEINEEEQKQDKEVNDEEQKQDEEVNNEEQNQDEEINEEEQNQNEEEQKNDDEQKQEAENIVEPSNNRNENVLAKIVNKIFGSIALAISNEQIDEDIELTWKGEFDYGPLEINANSELIELNRNQIVTDVSYDYNLHSNNGKNGSIFAKKLDATITLDFHDIVLFPNTTFYDGNGHVNLDEDNTLLDIIIKDYQDYTLNVEIQENNKINIKLSITNNDIDNQDIFNIVNALTINLHLADIVIPTDKLSAVKKQSVDQKVTVTVESYDEETKKIDVSKAINMDNSPSGITVKKNMSSISTPVSNGDGTESRKVDYKITIVNDSEREYTDLFTDVLSENLVVSDSEKERLENEGFTITYDDHFTITKNITIPAKSEVVITYNAFILPGIPADEIVSNTASFYDATETCYVSKKGYQDMENISLSKEVVARYPKYRYYVDEKSDLIEKITTGKDLLIVDDGDLIEYNITLENSADYSIFIPAVGDYCNRRGPTIGDSRYGTIVDSFVQDLKIDTSKSYKDFIDNCMEYRNSNGVSTGAYATPVIFTGVSVPAKGRITQTMYFLVARDTDYVEQMDSFAFLQNVIGYGKTPDENGYVDFVSTFETFSGSPIKSAEVTQKIMTLKAYNEKNLKVSIEKEKRYPNFMLGKREVITKDNPEINYVSIGDIIEYTLTIENSGDDLIDYSANFGSTLLGQIHGTAPLNTTRIASFSQFDLEELGIRTNGYYQLENYMYNYNSYLTGIYNAKIKGNTTYKQTIVEIVGTTTSDGRPLSYSEFYATMRANLNATVNQENGELYTNQYKMLRSTYPSNLVAEEKEVRVRSENQEKVNLTSNLEIIGRFPNYLNDETVEKIERGDLLTSFTAGDRLECLITIDNNTPIVRQGGYQVYLPYVSNCTIESGDEYNDIANNSNGLMGGNTFSNFWLEPFKTYRQKVYIDIPLDVSDRYNDGSKYSLLGSYSDVIRDKVELLYCKSPRISISSGVYVKQKSGDTSTNINDYKDRNLNYYKDDDERVVYYANIFNNSDVPMNLNEYELYIKYSNNQTFEGFCTIDEMGKVPRLIENNVTVGNIQPILVYPENEIVDEIEYGVTEGIYSTEKRIYFPIGTIQPGHGIYIIYSLLKKQDATGILESTVSMTKSYLITSKELMYDKETVAYPYYIEDALKLYTEDELDHETTFNYANYEKTQTPWDVLDYVTTPTNQRLVMWSGVHLKKYMPYKVSKDLYASGDAFGSGENYDSVCFEIDAIPNYRDSGDKEVVVYDVLRVDTSMFEEGKNVTDYYELEPELNDGKYLLIKNVDGTYSMGNLARALTDDTEVQEVTVKFYSGDLFKSNGEFDFDRAREDDNWVDEVRFINTPEIYENKVIMKFEIPNTFKQTAKFKYKLFLKDEAEKVDGIFRGINKAYVEITDNGEIINKDTETIPFIFVNDKINKNLKVTNVVLDNNDEPSQEYADVEFIYKVYKVDQDLYHSNIIDNADLTKHKYLFEFVLKSEEEKKLVDVFKENNVLFEKNTYYLVSQEEKKFFDTTVSCTCVSGDVGTKTNSGNYNVSWFSLSDVNTIEYVNRYNSLFDGTKRDVVINKKFGYFYSGDLIPEPLPAGSEIQFNMLDDEGNMLQFVELGISDESGEHYRLAEPGDANTINVLRTHNGKVFIEGLYKYINYVLVELNSPSDYTPVEDTLNVIIPSGDGAYSTDVINAYNYNNDVRVYKVDMDGNIITSDSATFTLRKSGQLMYFKPLGQIDGVNVYEMVGDTQVEGTVSEIETSNGEIRLVKMQIGNYILFEQKVPEGYFRYSNSNLYVVNSCDRASVNVINPRIANFQIIKCKSYDAGGYIINTDTPIEEDTAIFRLRKGASYAYFVKLNIQDESGEHYRLAETSDTGKVYDLETYKGKVYIEGLNESYEYSIYEQKVPAGYMATASSITANIHDGKINYYNTAKVNARTYIKKVDYNNNLVTSGVAKFEVTNESGEKFYFNRMEDEENSSLYELIGTELKDGSVCELETYNGQIHIVNIQDNTCICAKEIEAPQGYVKSDTVVKQIISDYDTEYEIKIKNGLTRSDFKIKKVDTNNNIIPSNSTIFEVYTESGELVHFTDLESGDINGRLYSYSTSGNTRLCTLNGFVYVKDMPIGDYKIKEVVAPEGYSLLEEDVSFELLSSDYIDPPTITVQDPAYVFGSEGYVSLSYQKIMERDNQDNYGYGFAITSGTDNYISVLSKNDIVNYTLNIANNAKKAFKNMVLINKLPNVDDRGTVNLDSERGSQFRISLDKSANIELRLFDEQGRYTIINPDQYRIDYTDKLEYSEDDWNGEESDLWYGDAQDSTQAFRITFSKDFELPSTYSVATLFDGIISDEANPGEIAWNSFGYRYYVDNIDLTAEPPKVGVMIAKALTITKKVVVNEKDDTIADVGGKEFEFYVYEKGNETPIKTITLKSGDTIEVDFKKLSGKDGDLEFGKTYIIREKEEEGYSIKEVKTNYGEAYYDSVEFETDPKKAIEIVFVNEKDYVEPEEPEKPSGDPEVPSGDPEVPSGDPEAPEKPDKPKSRTGGSTTRKISKDVEVVVTEMPNDKKDDVVVEETTPVVNDEEVIPPIDNNDYADETYVPDVVDISVEETHTVITTEELPKTGDNIVQYVLLFVMMISLEIVIRNKK